jgi:hypothetical protein
MILTLIGLILSFCGSAYLVYDTLINFSRLKSFVQIEYPNDEKRRKVYRYDYTKKGLESVKISKEEIKLAISLSLLSLGFLLQILEFFI